MKHKRVYLGVMGLILGLSALSMPVFSQTANQRGAAWRATNDNVRDLLSDQFESGATANQPVSITVVLKPKFRSNDVSC